VLLAATLGSACSEDHACTLIGANPGVRVRGGADHASVRICAGATCGTSPFVDGLGFVNLPTLRPGRKVDLQATYTDASRHMTSHVQVVPAKFEPNGTGCGPSVAAVTLRFDKDGRAEG
jgi:hypothetical protein